MTRIALALFAVAMMLAPVRAQSIGPVGPGPHDADGARLAGQFADWERPGTPMLVLHGFGRGIQVFADIVDEGRFDVELPPIGETTPLGSVPCNPVGGQPLSMLTEVDLLTPLPGFTTPSEATRGLGVIGMAALADDAYAAAIASPGSRRVAWIASRVAQALAPGECNNVEAFDVAAGWTPVTITYGPSGGPHHLRPGIGDGMGWYWWAFVEPGEP